MPYNPFPQPIGHPLTSADLHQLIDQSVAEGYYIEYKEDFPVNPKIGHSIASLANTYGGWYIVGVQTDGNNIAEIVSGFLSSKYPDPISKVRDVIRSHIQPVPVCFTQVVVLDADRSVLVVYVPGEQETPFVTLDGRIYRRLQDSSDPIFEKDRYALDRLVDQGREQKKKFAEFCQDERIFSKAEENQPWISIYLSPYPLGIIEKDIYSLNERNLSDLIDKSHVPRQIPLMNSNLTGTLPFNAVQTSSESIILRQVSASGPAMNSLTAELFFDGKCKLLIPLMVLTSPESWDSNKLESADVRHYLRTLSRDDSTLDMAKFINIGQLWLSIATLMAYYLEWLGDHPWVRDVKVRVEASDSWRCVAFCDTDTWGRQVSRYGLPVIMKDKFSIPNTYGRGLLYSLDDDESMWMNLCALIGMEFGLSISGVSSSLADAVTRSGRLPIETQQLQ